MKQIMRYLTALLMILLLAEIAPAQIIVKVKPQRPKVVIAKPSRAKKGHVWIGGHWTVKNKRYVWLKGHWKKARINHSWVAGHWKKTRGGWIWMPGHWRKFKVLRK